MNKNRIGKLQKQIKNPILIKKKENLFYLTGQDFENGYLLVTKNQVIFFGSGLEKIQGVKFESFQNLPLYLSKVGKTEVENVFTLAEYDYLRDKCRGLRAKFKIQHTKSPVDEMRQVKESEEIEKIKKSTQIVAKVFKIVKKAIQRPKITEIQLANLIQHLGIQMGAEDISFPAIVASGANAAIPHHIPSSKKLKSGESIIIDFGFKYKNYCSDFTRTVFLKRVPKRLEVVYNQVEKAYNESIKFLSLPSRMHLREPLNINKKGILRFARNGWNITGGDVYQRSVDVLAEAKLDKYFIHSLGHGTGLEIHELPNLSPKSKDILEPGMVFSIEPGVYIPRLGGVRIEDLVVLKEKGVEKFINISTKLKDNIL